MPGTVNRNWRVWAKLKIMNDFEKTPVMTETIIETLCDLIAPEDQTGEDKIAKDKSDFLKAQYESQTKEKQDAMDVVAVCLTGKKFPAIFSINEARNKVNQNVG